ncbi:MAG: EmrB/QacA family drug resistance transporter [Alphaproteobacteria bacterium 64-11]|nr:DHA2 family efflux MFS transporter permease subunit [Alphaproteobacteria bacterium]OJU11580.1 MAG: EmrB/QacA family drug resistance transporter [Alphaproteobacteria bacterium 64-11]
MDHQLHAAHQYDNKIAEWAVLLGSMAGVLMQALDTTIVNVALPYMEGSLSASRDQITWVLTSYIIAAAIMTAPVGWLAARFGKKNFLITCVAGFTIASMLCGAAQSLEQMVLFRLIQGVFGAALGPLSQAVMLDMYPPAKRGNVMAIWGMGVMLGPILGPTVGGILTDAYDWRWVFYINVPFGIASCVALWIFFKDTARDSTLRFDWFGFGALSVGLAALQLLLDRGTTKDWFSSTEIVVEALIAGIALYLFLVHMLTAEKPFIPRAIFRDRNFTGGMVLMFVMGMVLLASSALLSPYLQNLSGRTVTQTGFLMVPRGIGVMAAMMFAGRLTMKMDPRIIMTAGASLMIYSLWHMTGWTPSVSVWTLSWVTFVQGLGMGLIFNPMILVAFATLSPQLRTDGTGLTNLMRNIGSAIGVSLTTTILANSVQTIHAHLSGYASPFNRALGVNGPSMMMNPQIPFGLANLNSLLEYRAQVQAYANDFLFMFVISLPVFAVIWLMKRPEFAVGGTPKMEVVD